MNIQIVGVYVWKGKAYVPAQGKIEPGGPFVAIEPVQVVELEIGQLANAIQSALEAGHPTLPNLSRSEWEKRRDPMLAATGARTWSELYRKGANYTIEWSSRGVLLEISRLDKQGRWEYDIEKRRRFELGVTLDVIADVILTDVATSPELRSKPKPSK